MNVLRHLSNIHNNYGSCNSSDEGKSHAKHFFSKPVFFHGIRVKFAIFNLFKGLCNHEHAYKSNDDSKNVDLQNGLIEHTFGKQWDHERIGKENADCFRVRCIHESKKQKDVGPKSQQDSHEEWKVHCLGNRQDVLVICLCAQVEAEQHKDRDPVEQLLCGYVKLLHLNFNQDC